MYFLDVLIKCDNLSNSVCSRKDIFTGLGMKFTSYLPINYKRNIIATLTTHAFHICSNYQYLHIEFNLLRNFFQSNSFLFSKLFTFPTKVCTVAKNVIHMSLTYTGGRSLHPHTNLVKIFREFDPQTTLCVTIKCNITIVMYFKVNEKLHDNIDS